MVTDSLPFGGDMDETLQLEIDSEQWLHTAPMQELLAKGDQTLASAAAPSSEAPASAAAAAPENPTSKAEDSGSNLSPLVLITWQFDVERFN